MHEICFPGDPTAEGFLVYNCRCTLVSVVDGIDTSDAKRIARDPVTGKTEVIDNVTYSEWAEQKSSLKKNVQNDTISSPIDRRNSAKGKPQAMMVYDAGLNERQKKLLENMPESNTSVVVSKRSVSMKDLSALTAETGNEFAMFTKGNERLIIRGNENSVKIDVEAARKLADDGYRWSGHTHPGTDELTRIASYGDLQILRAFKQKQSVIYDSFGRYETFGG